MSINLDKLDEIESDISLTVTGFVDIVYESGYFTETMRDEFMREYNKDPALTKYDFIHVNYYNNDLLMTLMDVYKVRVVSDYARFKLVTRYVHKYSKLMFLMQNCKNYDELCAIHRKKTIITAIANIIVVGGFIVTIYVFGYVAGNIVNYITS